MGTLTAILATLWAGVCKILSAIPSSVWLILLVGAFCFYLGFQKGGGCGCGCRRDRPPRPPREWSLGVAAVPTGALIEVKTGIREKRTAIVALAYVFAPPAGDKYAEPSRANLERLVGRRVRLVKCPHQTFPPAKGPDGRTVMSDAEFEQMGAELRDEAAMELPGRLPARAIVYGEAGAVLGLEQVKAGWATCNDDAPATYKTAEAAAKKSRKGIWHGISPLTKQRA